MSSTSNGFATARTMSIEQFFARFRELCFFVVAILAILLVKFLFNKRRFIELAIKLPGPPAYPIVGNALKFACSSDQLLERIVDVAKPYTDVTPMRFWLGPILCIVIIEPHDIEVIINSQQASNKGSVYKFLYPFIGNGLISGSVWRRHRKILTQILNQRTLNSFIETINDRSQDLVEKLKIMANGEMFDIFSSIEACTIDINCETVMGYSDMNALDNPNHEFIHYTSEMYKIIHNRIMKVWLHPDCIFQLTSDYDGQQRARKSIHEFTKRCIEIKKQKMNEESSAPTKTSILQRLLEINTGIKELTDDELKDEIYTVYLASQDTMAVTASFAILMLGMHPDIQFKARSEVDDVLQDGKIDSESISRLKYLEMLIKETLRLFPIAPLLVREPSGEIKLDKCTIPKGCQVVLVPYITHRSPKYWKNPDEFIPERFTIEEHSKRHSYTFIPFSGGPMGCLGQKYAVMALKIILAKILQKYIIKSCVNFRDIKLRTDISIRSIHGYKVSLLCRDITYNC